MPSRHLVLLGLAALVTLATASEQSQRFKDLQLLQDDTPAVTPGPSPAPTPMPTTEQPVATDDSGGGLSGGWVFTIIILVGVTLYCGIGVAYKRTQLGVTGTESLPNASFWRGLPGLVSDGYNYTKERLFGGASNYNEMDNETGYTGPPQPAQQSQQPF